MCVEDFQDDLKFGYFNKTLSQNLKEIMSRVECYIKGEKINVEKRLGILMSEVVENQR